MKILIAEDDEISRILLESILVGEGHEVITAEDGEKAFRSFEGADFAMVITDWMMPNVDGVELSKRIRQACEGTAKHPYIIMVTAKNQTEDMTYALESGVDDFLAKPYDRDVLKDRISAGTRRVEMMRSPALDVHNPFTSLRDDHRFLLSMADILEVISMELEKGVPDDVIRWWDATALKMTMKVHLEKEDRYMSLFLDRLLSVQGEWLSDLSASSFDLISEEHERMTYLLNEVHTAIEGYTNGKKAIHDLMEEAKQSCATVCTEDDFAGTLMNFSMRYLENRSLKEESITVLQNSIEMYLNLFRTHEEMEEKFFFPFAERYMTEEDAEILQKEFKEIEEDAGIGEIKDRLLEINELSAVLSAGGKMA